jgi:diguanylate cyclase (GGDEF)-like protein
MASQSENGGQAADLLPSVQAWLERPSWHLRFPAKLEERFESDSADARRQWLFRCGLVGLAIFNLFFLTDQAMVPDITVLAKTIRLGFVSPIVLVLLFSLKFRHHPFLRESFQTIMPLVTLGGILAILLGSHHPNASFCLVGIVYVVIYALNVARLRFPFAIVLSLVTGLSSLFLVQAIPSLPASTHSFHLGTILAGLALGLFANHNQEQAERRSYLLALSERLRQIDLTRDNAALSLLAGTDALTGIANRRAFDQVLGSTQTQAAPCALIMFDVDHFKAYNDTYGHQAGDLCLQALARCFRQCLREGDFVARLGGEEFAIFIPGGDLPLALQLTKRIFVTIDELALPHSGSSVASHVTVSAGIAIKEEDNSTSDLMERADAALYRAKASGRHGFRIDGIPSLSPTS